MNLPPEIEYEKKGHIAYVRINRPDKMNAMTRAMFVGVQSAFADFNDDPDLRVAIFTGTGERAFCAGADLGSATPNASPERRNPRPPIEEHRHFDRIYKPIIAAVNGVCTAAGMEMLQGTDIRIAAEHARFGLGEVRWGLIPIGGSHVRLPRQIPYAIAMEMILTGQLITSEQAYNWGIVNRVVPADQLMTTAEKFAEIICANGPYAVRTAKETVLRAMNLPWTEAFSIESMFGARVLSSEDAQEGPKAFLEKRAPVWQGK